MRSSGADLAWLPERGNRSNLRLAPTSPTPGACLIPHIQTCRSREVFVYAVRLRIPMPTRRTLHSLIFLTRHCQNCWTEHWSVAALSIIQTGKPHYNIWINLLRRLEPVTLMHYRKGIPGNDDLNWARIPLAHFHCSQFALFKGVCAKTYGSSTRRQLIIPY